MKRIADHERIEVPIKDYSEFPERIKSKFDASGDCWEWHAAKTSLGYGCVYWRGKQRMAYRVVWELLVGPIPDELEIDHRCRNPKCVNPDHIQPVSHKVNMQRGYGAIIRGRIYAAKTHCPQAHPYEGDNVYRFGPNGSYRGCIECRKTAARKNYEKRKAQRAALKGGVFPSR